jgi:hypothetical protein
LFGAANGKAFGWFSYVFIRSKLTLVTARKKEALSKQRKGLLNPVGLKYNLRVFCFLVRREGGSISFKGYI